MWGKIIKKKFKKFLHYPLIDEKFVRYWLGLDEILKDTLEIPLRPGRERAGLDGWFFGRTINAFYINFIKP